MNESAHVELFSNHVNNQNIVINSKAYKRLIDPLDEAVRLSGKASVESIGINDFKIDNQGDKKKCTNQNAMGFNEQRIVLSRLNSIEYNVSRS